MTSRSLKTTTAILAVLSLMQPLPTLAQVRPGASDSENGAVSDRSDRRERVNVRSFEEICAEAMVSESRACEMLIRELQAEAEDEAQAAVDRAEQAATEAEAAGKLADEAEASERGAARAEAARLDRAAAVAVVQARVAAETAELLADEAEAAARAADEAEAAEQEQIDAEAEAAEQAADDDAQVQADAAAEAQAEADAQAEAEAAARAADEAEAAEQERIDAEAEAAEQAADDDAQVQADAAAEAQAEAEAQARADDMAAEEADARAAAEQGEDDSAGASPVRPRPAPVADDCLAEVVAPDGTIRCVDALTSEAIAAISADADAETEMQAEVITETITESTHRSSSEEFSQWNPDEEAEREESGGADADDAAMAQPDTGMSDLEKAGLFALGAVAVGAILSNGQRVETNTGDRVIVQDDDGSYRVLKDDDALLRQPGSEVRTERFNDGSTRTTVTRDDGTRIVTIRDSTGRALRRVRIDPNGREYLLIDDTRSFEPVIVRELPSPAQETFDYREASDIESLRQALIAAERSDIGRNFSLRQVREYYEVRELAPVINLEAITFATNSAALQPSQAERLRQMGLLMRELIAEDPTELFLVEGHTDAIGSAGYNLLLSDRRAESVALAFSEYFGVPTENMVVQGYGERFLKVPTQEAERVNRRVAVRRITPLLQRY